MKNSLDDVRTPKVTVWMMFEQLRLGIFNFVAEMNCRRCRDVGLSHRNVDGLTIGNVAMWVLHIATWWPKSRVLHVTNHKVDSPCRDVMTLILNVEMLRR